MKDRLWLWLVRAALAALAAGLVWWGSCELDLGVSLPGSADRHALERHGGAVLSELPPVFGTGALVLGGVAAVAALFPYRRFRRVTTSR